MMKKRSILFLILLLGCTLALKAGTGKPILFTDLPQTAQAFVNKHFSGINILQARVESSLFSKDYEVVLANSTKIEFDGDGEWKEINCKQTAVPVAIIPVQIQTYVRSNFSEQIIVEIERKSNKYEIKLNNSVEIEFDKDFNVIDIDL